MNITIIGTGYVGLVTGACFAETGNQVTCIDIDASKVEKLQKSEIPFFEPGLSELVARNIQQGRLLFSTDITQTQNNTDVYFICVGTPSRKDGSANLDYVFACIDQIATMKDHTILVIKSTVPIGTNMNVRQYLDEKGKRGIKLASNPEFLREGTAVDDSLKPDRVVLGVPDKATGEVLYTLYKPFFMQTEKFFLMSPASAEMTKYASNCYLATRISFMNEISQICEEMGADVNEIRKAMGADQRIGAHYLYPSAGIGGSCFPKDLRAMKSIYDEKGLRPEILTAVIQTNRNQKNRFFQKMEKYFENQGGLQGKTIAVWGVAFKANTDDIRESVALEVIQKLIDARADVRIYDPAAMANTVKMFGDKVAATDSIYAAAEGADAVCIMTEWNQFRSPDFERLKSLMKSSTIFDGRNLYSPDDIAALGFFYCSVGRATRNQK